MREAGQRLTSLVKVSVSQACGLTSFNLQVSTSDAMIAQLAPPSSEPANRAFLRFNAIDLMERSTVLVCVPWQGALFSPVQIRAGKLSLQPEVLGAGQEATNGLKHFEQRLRRGSTVRAGRNVSEHRAGLETVNVGADPPF